MAIIVGPPDQRDRLTPKLTTDSYKFVDLGRDHATGGWDTPALIYSIDHVVPLEAEKLLIQGRALFKLNNPEDTYASIVLSSGGVSTPEGLFRQYVSDSIGGQHGQGQVMFHWMFYNLPAAGQTMTVNVSAGTLLNGVDLARCVALRTFSKFL